MYLEFNTTIVAASGAYELFVDSVASGDGIRRDKCGRLRRVGSCRTVWVFCGVGVDLV